jgi:hypothetical protein
MDEQDHLEGAQPVSQDREQEPQGLVPPYEGRQTQAKEGLDEHMDKVFDRVDEVPPGPGREVSDEEREGVPATDTEATSPLVSCIRNCTRKLLWCCDVASWASCRGDRVVGC